jgi:hypothetical protein
MIALLSDCLLFQLASGESIPCSPEMISIELVGQADQSLDPEILRHAAASVFHYFKFDLERESVTIGEFAGALEKVLSNLGLAVRTDEWEPHSHKIIETDLGLFTRQSNDSLELLFYPRLRDELRTQLRQSPRVLRFRGLRGCVKQLAGARRWSSRCEKLQEQIVGYLRECFTAEPEPGDCALVVE